MSRSPRPSLQSFVWSSWVGNIKRLGERGILKNENGLITALVSKDEAQAYEIDELVEKKFEGSLPTFIAAFTKRQDLSEHELDEVQQMIDRIRRGETR